MFTLPIEFPYINAKYSIAALNVISQKVIVFVENNANPV